MKRMFTLLISLIIACGISVSAQAAFTNLGDGLIYDTDLNVTWLQDANYAMTSGYDADGLMTWNEANTWAEDLVFAGHAGWRLPTFDPDNTRPITATSVNEIGSLLNALTDGGYDLYPPYDISPFINLPHLMGYGREVYWTGLVYDGSHAWDYYMGCGWWGAVPMVDGKYAWAVHDGDVSAVPEPSTMLLLGSGLVGLFGLRKKFRKK